VLFGGLYHKFMRTIILFSILFFYQITQACENGNFWIEKSYKSKCGWDCTDCMAKARAFCGQLDSMGTGRYDCRAVETAYPIPEDCEPNTNNKCGVMGKRWWEEMEMWEPERLMGEWVPCSLPAPQQLCSTAGGILF
jgi:hypothetical protein